MQARDAEAHAVDVFKSLGITTETHSAALDDTIDLVLEADTLDIALTLKYRSLVTDLVAQQLIDQTLTTKAILFVVADRITAAARTVLLEHRAGYLDLRGRIALRAPSLILDTDIQPISTRTERTTALAGKAGLEVACAILTDPERSHSIRALARELGRSPSTVSDVLTALRRNNLIDTHNTLSGTELFWLAADHWHTPRTHLATLPQPDDATAQRPLRMNPDITDNQPGWALTDAGAAAMYGAPVPFRDNQRLDFYVPDQPIIRRAITLLGTADSAATARASIRVVPVPAAVRHRVDLDTNSLHWPLAHPVFVALDLAHDIGRGREILDSWTPEGCIRVW